MLDLKKNRLYEIICNVSNNLITNMISNTSVYEQLKNKVKNYAI